MAQPSSLRINVVVGGRFHASQLYEGLTDLGHDVHIYAASPARYFRSVPRGKVTFVPKPAQLLQKGLNLRGPRWLAEWSAVAFDWLVSRIMRPADVVWGFNGDSCFAALKAKERGSVYICDRACPHILSQEQLLQTESTFIGYPYEAHTRRTLSRFLTEYEMADRIVVPSRYSAGSFPVHGIDLSRVAIAPLDANAPESAGHESEPAKLHFEGISENDIVVGMVGGAFLRKGIIYLLRAVDALARPDIRIVLRASEANVLRHDEARRLCVKLGVIFVPYLNDINSFYRSVDMFVLPSVDEGFGMVLYEALRNGTPVIASSHVGAIDGMTPDREFIEVPAQDAEALGHAIERLADDPDLRRSMGNAGRVFHSARLVNGGHYRKALAKILQDTVGPQRAL